MPGYNGTSASTANSNYVIIEDVDIGANDYVEYKLVGEWVSTTEYEISPEMIALCEAESFWKRMEKRERLEKWKQKMITIDKKQIKTHITPIRQYYRKY